MLLLLGLSLTWLSIAISTKVLGGQAAFLRGLLLLTFCFYRGLDASHHWYSVSVVMAAVRIVIGRRTPSRLVWVAAEASNGW